MAWKALWRSKKLGREVMGAFYPNPLSKATALDHRRDTMGIIMFLKDDPTFLLRDLVVFLILGLIVFVGFFYILRNFKTKDSPVRG